jgi:outer membrane lipoprotein-sorting protein
LIFLIREIQRARAVFICFFVLTLLLATASCKRSDNTSNQNVGAANANGVSQETSATPPFATKEPERYQAVRIVTSSIGGGSADSGAEAGESKKTVIARDGDRRREDYETAGGTLSFLQLPNGTYLLLPEKKLYAEWKADAGNTRDAQTTSAEPVLPPDKLLNEARPQSHYEKLGTETINGRETVKYRVTVRGQAGIAKDTAIESLIWVDERLGMPVKSEMSSTDGAKVTMELRDITETVDENVFNLPQDYQKIEAREIFAQLKLAKAGTKP